MKEILSRETRSIKCHTDLDYIEEFIHKLHTKWSYLCESYINLTISIPVSFANSEDDISNSLSSPKSFSPKMLGNPATLKETNDSVSIQGRPFKLADLKRSDSFSSTDSENYLEKDVLKNLKVQEEKFEKTEVKCSYVSTFRLI